MEEDVVSAFPTFNWEDLVLAAFDTPVAPF